MQLPRARRRMRTACATRPASSLVMVRLYTKETHSCSLMC